MKIGLFFGSFNPIHCGHLIIANHIVNFYADEVWFVVSPLNPFKKNTELLDAEKRLDLTKLAIEDNNAFKICSIEFTLPIPSYTINTLNALYRENKNFKFFLIIGSDNFINIHTWKGAQEIINNYSILVYERPGFPLKKSIYSNIEFLDSALLDISSTKIRELIKQNRSIRYLVPEKVRLTIEEYGYYK